MQYEISCLISLFDGADEKSVAEALKEATSELGLRLKTAGKVGVLVELRDLRRSTLLVRELHTGMEEVEAS